VSTVETHLSRLFLTPDRVYKQLKAVTTGFVDLADPADRCRAAAREFTCNRRLAPDVYLGTADVVEDGAIVDRFVVMRRLPSNRQLDRLIGSSELPELLRATARLVASIHSAEPPVRGPAAVGATREVLEANWTDNFETLAPLVGSLIDTEDHAEAQRLVEGYLRGRGALFDERIAQGWVRDGHGDLRAEHVFCLPDGPRLIDCLAFRDDLRIADVLADVGFLAMDLHRLAGPDAALLFVRTYDEFAAEHHPSTLAHHYVAYRAHVRAKVAAIRHRQLLAEGGATAEQDDALREAADYHDLALHHLRLAQPRIVLVGGGAGVGKSTVAEGLAERVGAIWLRADEVRKALAGIPADQHAFAEPGQGIYTPEMTEQVYDELLREAALLVERGWSVVLDATWSDGAHRQAARQRADALDADLVEIECRAPLAIAAERIARRLAGPHGPSDATPQIAEHVAARFEPWPQACLVDTSGSIEGSIAAAAAAVLG
jgi:aminoglycoside phosphotransferase family enzyme